MKIYINKLVHELDYVDVAEQQVHCHRDRVWVDVSITTVYLLYQYT